MILMVLTLLLMLMKCIWIVYDVMHKVKQMTAEWYTFTYTANNTHLAHLGLYYLQPNELKLSRWLCYMFISESYFVFLYSTLYYVFCYNKSWFTSFSQWQTIASNHSLASVAFRYKLFFSTSVLTRSQLFGVRLSQDTAELQAHCLPFSNL